VLESVSYVLWVPLVLFELFACVLAIVLPAGSLVDPLSGPGPPEWCSALGWIALGWSALGWIALGWIALGWIALGWIAFLGVIADRPAGSRWRRAVALVGGWRF